MITTKEYLEQNPNHIFVFGDNSDRKGYGGAAILRDMPNTYGFVTKKHPDNRDSSFYTIEEYKKIYSKEINKLTKFITRIDNRSKLFLISKLGAGLANKNRIFEEVIEHNIKRDLDLIDNVRFLW
jgi:hypothetical protein